MPKCTKCDATDRDTGLWDLNAYAGGSIPQWLCASHMPSDWVGWPRGRLNAHELLAIHAHVAKNLETLTNQIRTPGSGGEHPD
jgi:hypothetical protein